MCACVQGRRETREVGRGDRGSPVQWKLLKNLKPGRLISKISLWLLLGQKIGVGQDRGQEPIWEAAPEIMVACTKAVAVQMRRG